MTNGTYQINSPENSERCLFLRFAHIHTHTNTHTHTLDLGITKLIVLVV